MSFVLKWRSYDGRSDSVIRFYPERSEAVEEARKRNEPYQDNYCYYVEPYDPVKAAEWGKTMNAQRAEVRAEGAFMPS